MENNPNKDTVPAVDMSTADNVVGFAAPSYADASAPVPQTAAPVQTAAPAYAAFSYSRDSIEQAQTQMKIKPVEPDPCENMTDEEIKTLKKQKRREFNINAALVGAMMVVFMLIMNFVGSYVNQIAMFIAIPDVVSEVFSEGGLAAVENFYYDEYSAEGGKYFATSGITDNIGYCFFVLLYFIPFAIFGINRGLRGKIFGPGKGFDAKFLFTACGIGMGFIYLWAVAYNLLAVLIPELDFNYIFTLFDTSSNAALSTPLGTLFYVIGTCVFAPIGEEFVCRGVMLGTLKKYGSWWAIFITAALFGLMHMNFYQGPYAFLMGLVLGYVTVKTGSIWCAVIIHMINNSWSCIVGEVLYEFVPFLRPAIDTVMGLAVYALMIIAFVGPIVLAVKGKLGLPGSGEPRRLKVRAKTLRFAVSPLNLLYIAFCIFYSILLILPA